MDYAHLKTQAEERIRAGDFAAARKLMAAVKARHVPRKYADEFANLARRAGRIDLSLKILAPIIRPEATHSLKPATVKEQANYAVSLLRIGAISEARALLIDHQGEAGPPEIQLYLGFAYASEWRYSSAASHFRSYLADLGGRLTDYQKAVARVNLFASYLALGDRAAAAVERDRLISETQSHGWTLLYLNTLELSAQLAIQDQNFAAANEEMSKASLLAPASDRTYQMLIRKWKAVAQILEAGPSGASFRGLDEVRAEASAIGHWETMRDLDYYRALASQDQSLFCKVYFATRLKSYRQRVRETAARLGFEIPATFRLQPGGEGAKRAFDLRAGAEVDSSCGIVADLKPGRALYRAFSVLASDFYRPFPVGSLHAELFPDDYFNPNTSPGRVAFLLSRLREWLRASQVPARIEKTSAGFFLKFEGPYDLIARSHRSKVVKIDFQLQVERLRSSFVHHSFSSTQAAKQIEISERQARKVLAWAVSEKRLRQQGRGRATRYSFAA